MRTKSLLLLLLLILLPMAPAAAHDSDLIETKVKLSLARLADAIASEGAVTNHAARLALANDILNNLDQHTRRFVPRILTNAVNCMNEATENDVYNQVIALFGNLLLLNEAQAGLIDLGGEELAQRPEKPKGSPITVASRKP
jgi:hypothetical protein